MQLSVFNAVGICRQPYYCSSARYGRLRNNLKSAAFSVTFDEINHYQQTGFVNVNCNHYPIELFLSSDMKVGYFVWYMEQPHVCSFHVLMLM